MTLNKGSPLSASGVEKVFIAPLLGSSLLGPGLTGPPSTCGSQMCLPQNIWGGGRWLQSGCCLLCAGALWCLAAPCRRAWDASHSQAAPCRDLPWPSSLCVARGGAVLSALVQAGSSRGLSPAAEPGRQEGLRQPRLLLSLLRDVAHVPAIGLWTQWRVGCAALVPRNAPTSGGGHRADWRWPVLIGARQDLEETGPRTGI